MSFPFLAGGFSCPGLVTLGSIKGLLFLSSPRSLSENPGTWPGTGWLRSCTATPLRRISSLSAQNAALTCLKQVSSGQPFCASSRLTPFPLPHPQISVSFCLLMGFTSQSLKKQTLRTLAKTWRPLASEGQAVWGVWDSFLFEGRLRLSEGFRNPSSLISSVLILVPTPNFPLVVICKKRESTLPKGTGILPHTQPESFFLFPRFSS